MPKYWYDYKACNGDPFLQSICVEKKPYFMTYVYDDYRRSHNKYIKETKQSISLDLGENYEDLHKNVEKNEKKAKFLSYFDAKYPFGTGACAMNRICWHIEEQFKQILFILNHVGDFDYNYLKQGVDCSSEHIDALCELGNDYLDCWHKIKGNTFKQTNNVISDQIMFKSQLKKYIRKEAKKKCPDEEERADIILDLAYQNKCHYNFLWDCVGDVIIRRLEKLMNGN